MKIIFEKETDEDFLEIILTETEARDIICHDVIAKDFPSVIKKKRNLNICVRIQDAVS